jgi:hypothetical protein
VGSDRGEPLPFAAGQIRRVIKIELLYFGGCPGYADWASALPTYSNRPACSPRSRSAAAGSGVLRFPELENLQARVGPPSLQPVAVFVVTAVASGVGVAGGVAGRIAPGWSLL